MAENGQKYHPLHDDLQQITERSPEQPSSVWGTLGMLANMVRSVTGRSRWSDSPPTNLTEAKAHHDATGNVHNLTRAQLDVPSTSELSSHTANQQNPHRVTAQQANAAPASHVGTAGTAAHPLVETNGQPGFMAGTDKAKLNGLNSADYAPSSHVGSGGSAHPPATASQAGFITSAEKNKLASVNVIDTSFRCELTRDSDISFVNGAWTAIPWNVETLDPRGWHDNATNPTRISPGSAGTYLVQFYMAWRSGSGTREHMVGMNGSHMAPRNRVDCAVNPNGTMSSVFIVNLTAASDYIELFAKQDSGGTLNLFGTSNTVIVARIL